MAWYKVNIPRRQVDGDKGKKISESLRGLEGPWKSLAMREAWLTHNGKCYSAGDEWDRSLGTIGAGNHFAEIQVIESSETEELPEDTVVLLVHSGSRGFGGDTLKKFAPEQNTSFHEDSEEAKAYLQAHEIACEWAKANRDLIALRFLHCLEPGCESWDINPTEESTLEHIQSKRGMIQARKVVDIWHNNVQKVVWPPKGENSLEEATSAVCIGNPEAQKFAYIHRKGAAPTYSPETKLPLSILPLPGSRGTPTLILRPKFSKGNGWGLHNAMSLAHGAGRSMSRTKALASLGQKYKDADKLLVPTSASQYNKSANGEDVHGGTWGTFCLLQA
jgi:RNA-splicing ligase RtcB